MIVQGINDSHLLSAKITDEIIKDKVVIGTFIKNTAEISAINLNHVYNVLNNTYISIQSFGTWYVEEISDDEANSQIKIKLSDLSKKFDKDYEDTFIFPATLKQWATWIGTKVGVSLSGTFPNEDVLLSKRPYIGNAPTYREAVKKIAKYAGCYARTNYDNTYSFKWFNPTTTVIEDFIAFEHGDETNAVNTLVLSTGITNDNVEYPETPVQNPVEIRIDDDFNYLDRFDLLEDIYEQVNGFKYVPIKKLEVPYGLLGVRAGDKISCQDMERNDIDTFISSNTLQWQGGPFTDANSWQSTLKMSELTETKTDHKKAQTIKNQLLDVKRQADKNEGNIQDLITATDELNEWSTEVNLSLENLLAEVRKKPTITVENDGVGTVLLENVAPVKLAYLSVHPTNTDIVGLFVSNDLIIHPGLKIRSMKVKFVGIKNVECKVPKSLYYYNSEIYDEYIFDGNEEKAYVIRRVSIDSQGNKSPLAESYTEECEYQELIMGSGDYEINMPSYPSAYISVKAMMQNEYTDSFATKIEMLTGLKAIIERLELSVKRLVDKRQIIAALNMAIENEESILELIGNKVIIHSDKFDLDRYGNAIFRGGSIYLNNGSKIMGDDGLMSTYIIFSPGHFTYVGYDILGEDQDHNLIVKKSKITFDFDIPDNFVIQSAHIVLIHTPTHLLDFYDPQIYTVGYSRNLKLYKSQENIPPYIEVDALEGYMFIPDNNVEEIPNAFGPNGFTGSPSGGTKQSSFELKDYINNGVNQFIIQTSNGAPATRQDADLQSGACSAMMYITGYMNYKDEPSQPSLQQAPLLGGGLLGGELNQTGEPLNTGQPAEQQEISEPLNVGEPMSTNTEEESDI